jgi:hypothetical protein
VILLHDWVKTKRQITALILRDIGKVGSDQYGQFGFPQEVPWRIAT